MDYTITHPCGLDEKYASKQGALKEALKHWDACGHRMPSSITKDGAKDWVAVDEYDTEGGDMGGGEMTGRYWKVGRDAMMQPFVIELK